MTAPFTDRPTAASARDVGEGDGNGDPLFDCAVVGGGPAGATAALMLARAGHSVALIDRAGRVKPCGGAIPPRLIADFAIPDEQLVARATAAKVFAPSGRQALMPIRSGFVGMVDRANYDEWLRNRAAEAGALRVRGTVERLEPASADGTVTLHGRDERDRGHPVAVRARFVIGADGARSVIAREAIAGATAMRYVFAVHEIVASPPDADGAMCEVHYDGRVSPDFYGWVFPHGATTSVGLGSAHKGFPQRPALDALRRATGLADARTIRREGGPIPLKPLRRWDNGRNVVLAGDAAGVVAPASGEGIYYAMLGGQLAAEAVDTALRTGDGRALRSARRRFMRLHGGVFRMLGLMQRFWYASDGRRERFVTICRDPDVQALTWEAYMNKALVRARPAAHLRIFGKNLVHLIGLARSAPRTPA